MRDELLYYYERELGFLRRMGAEFADRYPKIASRLVLEPNKCEDPHVERLLEGFAFLAGRVHLKIDDEFPEITEALLNTVYPHYIRPIPSMSIAQFSLDPEQGKLAKGMPIPRGAALYSRPVNGVPCKFQTAWDLTLWPIHVTAVEWKTPERLHPPVKGSDAVAALRVELKGFGDLSFDKMDLKTLRFYLGGEGNSPYSLYELLANNCERVLIRDSVPQSKKPIVTLSKRNLRPAGFEEDEALLPYPKRSFRGYRLLQEYFAFPQKFLFLDLSGFEKARASGFGNTIELVFLIQAFERGERHQALEGAVNLDSFAIGCVPVINLFRQTSEPILLDQRKNEYEIVPDARRRQTTEVYSVDDVVGITPDSPEPIRFEPFYAHRHSSDGDKGKMFWYATRRPGGWGADTNTDVFLSMVDMTSRTVHPDVDAITTRLMCFNRDLPSRLPFGNDNGDFELESGGPIKKVVAIVKPTSACMPPMGKALQWRLISQLSLNYLSLVDEGKEALQEILRLYNFSEFSYLERQIDGIENVTSSPTMAQIVSSEGMSFVRGRKVEIEFDEENFAGGGVYLFASLLERFLGLYVALNSFSILSVRTMQRKEVVRQWPPRSGNRVLL